jgi:anti-sigma factor RsiW
VSYRDLPCRDFVELTTDYLEGTLDAEQRLLVEYHLAFCGPCVTYLDQMREVVTAVGSLRADDVPEPVMDSLIAAFRSMTASDD